MPSVLLGLCTLSQGTAAWETLIIVAVMTPGMVNEVSTHTVKIYTVTDNSKNNTASVV